MIKIETIGGIMYCHKSDIMTFWFEEGRYFLLVAHGASTQKWEITETTFNFLVKEGL